MEATRTASIASFPIAIIEMFHVVKLSADFVSTELIRRRSTDSCGVAKRHLTALEIISDAAEGHTAFS